jgi:hypothetical protein
LKVVSFGNVSSELLTKKGKRERERDARGRKKVFSAFLLFYYSDVFFFSSVALRRGGRR